MGHWHLQRIKHATVQNLFYLIRCTSSKEVCSFSDWQPDEVKADLKPLHEALIKEFSNPETEHGLNVALDNKADKNSFGATTSASIKPILDEELNQIWKMLTSKLSLSTTFTHHYLGLMANHDKSATVRSGDQGS